MPETIPDLLTRLRKQDYTISLTDAGRINAKPPAGALPDHIRAVLTARKEDIVAYLRAEQFQCAKYDFHSAVFRMMAEYEARKPYTRYWAEGRALVDIWYGIMPQKEDYDEQRTEIVLAAVAALDAAVAVYFRAWDTARAAISSADSAVQ